MTSQPQPSSHNASGSYRTVRPEKQGLYDPSFEKENCGVGFVAHIKGERSHQIVLDAETILINMDHRGGCGCEPNTGDGAGILTALPLEFIRKVAQKDLNADLPEPGQFAAGIVFLPRDERASADLGGNALVAVKGAPREEQARAFVLHALAVVAEGRPLCQLCGLPIDPSGHICPASNGHRSFG
jgi:glutamate synthase domain-containing protein 1